MKNFFNKTAPLTIVLMLLQLVLNAQDEIYKKDQTIIKCKVAKVGANEIEYKKWENIDGPTYSLMKSELLLIHYQNGTSDFFNDKTETPDVNLKTTTPVSDNGTKISSDQSSDVNSAKTETNGNNITDIPGKTEEPNDFSIGRIALDGSGTSVDLETEFRLAKRIYLGLSFYGDYSTYYGLYPYLAYKFPLNKKKSFFAWVNAGYNFTSTFDTYDSYGDYQPGASSSGFLYEVGTEVYFGKTFGVTIYTSQFQSYWFGICIRI